MLLAAIVKHPIQRFYQGMRGLRIWAGVNFLAGSSSYIDPVWQRSIVLQDDR